MEEWKSVPSDKTLEASSLGRIQIASRKHPTYGQWDGKRYLYCRRGYPTRKVARLVCEAFHGPAQQGQVCMHLDEDSRNNSPNNLRWGTQKENLNFPGFLAYCKTRTGENSPVIKGRNHD